MDPWMHQEAPYGRVFSLLGFRCAPSIHLSLLAERKGGYYI